MISSIKDSNPRLFCVLVQTQLTQERFVYLSNITWATRCHKIGIVRYRRMHRPDEGKLTELDEICNVISMGEYRKSL